jgi:hypothetical protein
MGARNQVGIGLSYRPAGLCRLASQFQTRFLESIPRPIAGLKIPTLVFRTIPPGWESIPVLLNRFTNTGSGLHIPLFYGTYQMGHRSWSPTC